MAYFYISKEEVFLPKQSRCSEVTGNVMNSEGRWSAGATGLVNYTVNHANTDTWNKKLLRTSSPSP